MLHLFVSPAQNISVENLIKARKNALSGGISGLACVKGINIGWTGLEKLFLASSCRGV